MNNPARWACTVIVGALALGACGGTQARKANYVQQGQTYLAAGNYEKARLELRNAAQIDPKDGKVRFLLGQVAEKSGDPREAVSQYQAAIAANPKDLEARASLGRIYLLGGLPDKAKELAETGLADDQNSAPLLTVRGAAYAQLGDAQKGFEDAQRAVQLAPGDAYCVALLASLYKKQNQLDKAVAVVESGLQGAPNSADLHIILADLRLQQQQPAAAEDQMRAVIALEPKVPLHRYRLAMLYQQQKNVDAAEKTLREAVQSLPDSLDAKERLVQFLSEQRGAESGGAQADQFFAGQPKDNKLKLALGQLLEREGQTERAERAYRAVIADNGTGADGLAARDRMASLLLERKDVPGATAMIAEVLKANPRDNAALALRGEISLSQGDTDSAIEDLRAVLRDQPNAVPIMRVLAKAYQRNNELDAAEKSLRTAVEIAPTDFQSRFDLSQVLVSSDKLDQGGALLEQLAKEKPDSILVQQSLFRVQAAQKRYQDAISTAQGIQRTNPKLGMGYYLAGLVEEQNQKTDAAAKDYEAALQREPDAAEPLTALVHLEVRNNQIPAAIARLDAVIARNGADALARDLKSGILLGQGKVDAAIAAYQDTIKAAPAWPQAYHGLAIAQIMAKRDDDAVRTLQEGMEQTHYADVLVGDLGGIYQRLGRPDAAVGLYDQVLAKRPSSIFATNNLAMLLITYRSDPASLAKAQKLADQLASSSQVDLMDTRGWVKFKTGDFHGAESLLQQAVDKAPAAPEIRYHLGMAQLRSGEQQAARQNLESAVSANRLFPGIDDARAALAELKKSSSVG